MYNQTEQMDEQNIVMSTAESTNQVQKQLHIKEESAKIYSDINQVDQYWQDSNKQKEEDPYFNASEYQDQKQPSIFSNSIPNRRISSSNSNRMSERIYSHNKSLGQNSQKSKNQSNKKSKQMNIMKNRIHAIVFIKQKNELLQQKKFQASKKSNQKYIQMLTQTENKFGCIKIMNETKLYNDSYKNGDKNNSNYAIEQSHLMIKLSTDAFTKPVYFQGFKQIIFKDNQQQNFYYIPQNIQYNFKNRMNDDSNLKQKLYISWGQRNSGKTEILYSFQNMHKQVNHNEINGLIWKQVQKFYQPHDIFDYKKQTNQELHLKAVWICQNETISCFQQSQHKNQEKVKNKKQKQNQVQSWIKIQSHEDFVSKMLSIYQKSQQEYNQSQGLLNNKKEGNLPNRFSLIKLQDFHMMISLRIINGQQNLKQYHYLKIANAIPLSNLQNMVQTLKNTQTQQKKQQFQLLGNKSEPSFEDKQKQLILNHNKFINQSTTALERCLIEISENKYIYQNDNYQRDFSNNSLISVKSSRQNNLNQMQLISCRNSKFTQYLQPILQHSSTQIVIVCCLKGQGFGSPKFIQQFSSSKIQQNNQIYKDRQTSDSIEVLIEDIDKYERNKQEDKKVLVFWDKEIVRENIITLQFAQQLLLNQAEYLKKLEGNQSIYKIEKKQQQGTQQESQFRNQEGRQNRFNINQKMEEYTDHQSSLFLDSKSLNNQNNQSDHNQINDTETDILQKQQYYKKQRKRCRSSTLTKIQIRRYLESNDSLLSYKKIQDSIKSSKEQLIIQQDSQKVFSEEPDFSPNIQKEINIIHNQFLQQNFIKISQESNENLKQSEQSIQVSEKKKIELKKLQRNVKFAESIVSFADSSQLSSEISGLSLNQKQNLVMVAQQVNKSYQNQNNILIQFYNSEQNQNKNLEDNQNVINSPISLRVEHEDHESISNRQNNNYKDNKAQENLKRMNINVNNDIYNENYKQNSATSSISSLQPDIFKYQAELLKIQERQKEKEAARQSHLKLYMDEEPFEKMEIFKDVVGLTKKELEQIKQEKSYKKNTFKQGVDQTVGAKMHEQESSSGVEYHVNDQEPFYDAGSVASSQVVSNHSELKKIQSDYIQQDETNLKHYASNEQNKEEKKSAFLNQSSFNINDAFQDKNSLSLENTLQEHTKIERPSIKSIASVDEDLNSLTIQQLMQSQQSQQSLKSLINNFNNNFILKQQSQNSNEIRIDNQYILNDSSLNNIKQSNSNQQKSQEKKILNNQEFEKYMLQRQISKQSDYQKQEKKLIQKFNQNIVNENLYQNEQNSIRSLELSFFSKVDRTNSKTYEDEQVKQKPEKNKFNFINTSNSTISNKTGIQLFGQTTYNEEELLQILNSDQSQAQNIDDKTNVQSLGNSSINPIKNNYILGDLIKLQSEFKNY